MQEMSKKQFEQVVRQTLKSLPEKFKNKLHNAAIFVAEEPTVEQLEKIKLRNSSGLFGLFEGYAQGRGLNFGPVLPDRITIFRRAILEQGSDLADIKRQIIATVKHEIAHHFGSDEKGAAKAGRV
jgi:predicted Zn-dependent protease with MMP-like domain